MKELEAKGMLLEEEGRKIMWGTEEKDAIPMTIVKSDGGFTYDTSDMAAIKHRLEEEKSDWLIYITDAGQVSNILNRSSNPTSYLHESFLLSGPEIV